MLRRSVARCLQPLIRNSAPPTLTGSAQNAGECARALWQGIGGSASQTAWRSSATGPASDAPAQAPTTQLTQHATHWLAPSPRWQLAWQASAGWQQTRRWSSRAPAGRSAPGPVDAPKPVSSAPSPGASADVQPDAKPGASTPAPGLATRQVAASAGTAVTKPLAAAEDSQRPVKAPSQAAEGLIPALRDVYDIGTWERVLDQHSDRITPQNAVPAWLQCASFARKATPDVHTAISLMSAIVSLQPHVCTHLQDAASTQEAACVYTGLHAIDATVAKGFSRRKGQGESTGTVSVGVSVPGHVHTQYRPMVQQLAVLCESKLAEVGVEQLTLDVAKPLSQRLFVPGYTQVAPALVYFVSNHRYYTVRDKHRVCKAVLTAMGQDIQTNASRVVLAPFWQPADYGAGTEGPCMLLDLQRVMGRIELTVGVMWGRYMGDATLAALSACPPDQWSDGHVRLLAAWQQSGAAADTPVGTAIAQLAAQRSRQHGGQAVAGAVASAANQPAPAAAVAAAQGAATAAGAAATAAPLTVAGSQPAAATAAPGPQPSLHTPAQDTVSAVSSGTEQGVSHAPEDALVSLLRSAPDVAALRQLLEQHRSQLQPQYIDASWHRLMHIVTSTCTRPSNEELIGTMAMFITLQPHLTKRLDSAQAPHTHDDIVHALDMYTDLFRLSRYVTHGIYALSNTRGECWQSEAGVFHNAQFRPVLNGLVKTCVMVLGAADRDGTVGVLGETVGIGSEARGVLGAGDPSRLVSVLGGGLSGDRGPRYHGVAEALTWLNREHRGVHQAHGRPLGEAVLAAMGRHIQANVDSVKSGPIWQSCAYTKAKKGNCLLLSLQSTMYGLGMVPVGEVWHTHMGDATLAALSACPPDQWSDGHTRLLAAWQQSGAAADTPVGKAIAQLAAQRSGGNSGQVAAGAAATAAPAAAIQFGPGGLKPAEQGSSKRARRAAKAKPSVTLTEASAGAQPTDRTAVQANKPTRARQKAQETGNPAASTVPKSEAAASKGKLPSASKGQGTNAAPAASARPAKEASVDKGGQAVTSQGRRRPNAASTSTSTHTAPAHTDTVLYALIGAKGLTTLHDVLQEHKPQMQPHHARAAWRLYSHFLKDSAFSPEALTCAMAGFSLLQPFLCAYVTESDTEGRLRALGVYRQVYNATGHILRGLTHLQGAKDQEKQAQSDTDGTQDRSFGSGLESTAESLFKVVQFPPPPPPKEQPPVVDWEVRAEYMRAFTEVCSLCEAVMASVQVPDLARELGVVADGGVTPRFYYVAPAFLHFVRALEGPGTKHRARVCEALLSAIGRHTQDHAQDIPTRAVWQPPYYRVRTPGACLLLDLQDAMRSLDLPVGTLWVTHFATPTLLALKQCRAGQWSNNHRRLLAAWEQAGTPQDTPAAREIAALARRSGHMSKQQSAPAT